MSQAMSKMIKQQYRRWVIDQPAAILLLIGLVVAASLVQIPKTTLDASADSLLLQGDPSLADFRDVSDRFGSAEFLLLTWQPSSDLLSAESLEPLSALADELRALDGVRSVVTVLDVPLLESPPLSLSDVTSGTGLPTLSDPAVDRGLALTELTTSPIYSELLASQDGRMTAVQVNLEPFEAYDRAISRRESLRLLAESSALSQAQQQELLDLAQLIKASSAEAMETRSTLVAEVRQLADKYRQDADIFVGGVPMIASDMVSFVRSDLVVFGAAILGVMVVVLGAIFRRVRWVVIPLTTCIVTVTVTLGILAALDWRMTVISSNFVAVLLVVALSIAIHLVVRYREIHRRWPELAEVDRIEATMAAMAVPCIYTGLTTIVAFLSLLVSRIQPVIDFGAMMSVGIVLALLFAFTLVPSLMRLWPAGKPVIHAADEQPFTRHFARWVDERGGTIVSVTVVLIALVGVGISQLKVENRFIDYFKQSTEIYQGMELLDAQLGGTIGLDITVRAPAEDAGFGTLFGSASSEQQIGGADNADDFFTDDDPFAESAPSEPAASPDDFDEFAFDQDSFSGAVEDADQPAADSFTPSYWFSVEGRREIAAIHAYLESRNEVGKVLSLDTLFQTVEGLMGERLGSVELALVQRSLPSEIADLLQHPYVDLTRDEARISLRVKETSETLRRDEFIRSVAADLEQQLAITPERTTLSGLLVLYNNVLQSLFASQIMTLGAVFGAILVMFYALFRSLNLALLALAPNILAAGLVLGIMGLAGIPLDIMTITIAAIVVGIGVDNCIHYVHRFLREFAVDRNYTAAMHRCHGSIGRAMYYTTLTVVIGFSMLMLSNFKPSIYFGALTVAAMVAAVLGALLVLPRSIVLLKPLGPEASDAVS